MSDLHTTAIATGGTSFDTATCIGGKCEYPLLESGIDAKVYTHDMLCTATEYEKGILNSTLQTFDSTNAPEGSKPTRSPFDDDANAFCVGDFSLTNIGNGLVKFQRKYATVPDTHIEPYGLYSRGLPSYTVASVSVAPTAVNTLVLKEQYSTDGVNWTTRATTSAGDNVVLASTVDGESNVTVNDATLDWKDYSFVRLQYTCNLETSSNIFTDTPLEVEADFNYIRIPYSLSTPSTNTSTTAKVYNEIGGYSCDIGIRCKEYYGYDASSKAYRDSHRLLGSPTIESVTVANSETSIVAVTAPFNISEFHSESLLKDFGGIEIGRHTYYHSSWYFGGTKYTLYYDRIQDPSNVDNFKVPEFTRESGVEVNCSANIQYRYLKSDSPENITLESSQKFPDALTTTTKPSTQQYLSYVANGDYFNAENEFIERYIGNIYRMGLIRSTLQ